MTELGRLLRFWRERKGLSQMGLEMECGVSARHVSFIENGRSGATLDTLLRLMRGLDVPLRERNALVVAAGFQPYYRETGLSEAELERTHRALAVFLENQDPFPAVVMDREFKVVMTNRGMQLMLRSFCDLQRMWGAGPPYAFDILLSPHGCRPHISNWETLVPWLLGIAWREAYGGAGDPLLQAEFQRELRIPGVADLWREPQPGQIASPIGEMHWKKLGIEVPIRFVYFTFGTTEDVYVRHLRLICGQPINDTARRFARWLTRTAGRRALDRFRP